MPTDILTLLDRSAPIDTAALDPAARLPWLSIPAKPAVYLLTDALNIPLLLATVGNLRAALQRRLADTPPEHKSKRLPYGQLCTTLRYRIVCSPFSANYHYLHAARTLFPDTYRTLISWRPAWFLAVNPLETHPRFRRTDDLSDPAQTYLGPISDKTSAAKLIETLEDLFDLCRYYHILQQAPLSKACAYKEMGKCPAPCDGSVSLDHYRTQIQSALSFLTAPPELSTQNSALNTRPGYSAFRRALEARMQAAAAALNFESAAALKSKLTRAAFFEQPQFSHLDTLPHFSYLSLQCGQGKPWIEPFFIHGPTITPAPPVKRPDLPTAANRWFKQAHALAAKPIPLPLSPHSIDQLALVAHHLFRSDDQSDPGLYLPVSSIPDPAAILQAATTLLTRRTPQKPMAEQSSEPTPPEDPASPPLPGDPTNP